MDETRLVYRVHAIELMFRRGIGAEDIRHVLAGGETIKEYPEDLPYPSRLVLGWQGSRPIHVVVAENAEGGEAFIVTVYEPDPDLWEPGFRRKRP